MNKVTIPLEVDTWLSDDFTLKASVYVENYDYSCAEVSISIRDALNSLAEMYRVPNRGFRKDDAAYLLKYIKKFRKELDRLEKEIAANCA